MKTCAACVYFLDHSCRRYPPTPTAMSSIWPMVREDHWCGEHKSAKAEQPGVAKKPRGRPKKQVSEAS